jgi:hypothetical protein
MILKMDLSPPPEKRLRGLVTRDQRLDGRKSPVVETMKIPAMDARHDIEFAILTFEDGADILGDQTVPAAICHKSVRGNPRRRHPQIPLYVFGFDWKETLLPATHEPEPHILSILMA